MASVKDRAAGAIARLRARRPFVDHLVRMQGHYGSTKASQQAGAVTYFAFLSFFPILALAFFVVGYASKVYPQANSDLRDAISAVLPGIIGTGDGQIQLEEFRSFSGLAGIVGLLGVIYSGLGWISALRDALTTVFETPQREQPSFVVGKLRDLLTLAVIGTTLIGSVAVTSFVSGFSSDVLAFLGLDTQLGWLVRIVALVLGLGANVVLFFAIFTLLAEPHVPRRSLLSGALLGAVGFEVLKQVSSALIASTKGQPAFQAFGIALILLVWINYFTRVMLYSASFACTSRGARRQREEEKLAGDSAVSTPASVLAAVSAAGAVHDATPEQPAPPPPPRPSAARGRPTWMDDFVDKIDKATPDDVGEESAAAARAAHEEKVGTRHRILAAGAAASTAGVAVMAVLRRRKR